MELGETNEICLDKCMLHLSETLNDEFSSCHSNVNLLLDKLNAFDFNTPIKFKIDRAEIVLEKCYNSIPPSETFLVAKCCQLTLNLIEMQSLQLSDNSLRSYIEWVTKALQSSADVAYLDILQSINAVITHHPTYFHKFWEKIVWILDRELEKKSCLADPSDVKVWRIKCLHSLAMVLPVEYIPQYASKFIDLISIHPTTNLLSHAQVWKSSLEALDGLCNRDAEWLEEYLCEILGVVLAGIHLGLNGITPKSPKQLYASLTVSDDCPDTKINKPKVNIRGRKKSKHKVKQVGWSKKEDSIENEAEEKFAIDHYNPAWPTSDSDLSDGEGGKSIRISREQARTRHAAINLLIQLVKVCGCKPLYGYYGTLLGGSGLIYSLQNETATRPRIAALVATTALLTKAKLFFAQAQHSEGPFTSFSSMLADLMYGLQSTLINLLAGAPPVLVAVPLLQTTSALLSVIPYHRLRPSLLLIIFKPLQPYIKHKDPTVCVGALKCLTEIVTADVPTCEHETIIMSGVSNSGTEDGWLVALCLENLEIGGRNETLQVGWWQVMSGLCKCHFPRVIPFLTKLEVILFRDLASSSKYIQRYSTHTLEFISGHIVANEELRSYSVTLWIKLLEGPLIPILQSPSMVASVGCDCVANLGPFTYTKLKEELQILVITLLYGCSYHEEAGVRASAIRTLGMFLLFPQVVQEQFVCDVNDIIVKALSDPIQLVRVKAAWAFGNLADLLLANQDKEYVGALSVIKLLDASLSLESDTEKVKANILRAVGTLLLLVNEQHLEELRYREAVGKAATLLARCATSGISMKMRWNACYAMGNMLRNEYLHRFSSDWQIGVISSLCSLLVKCNHFKVRLNASYALCVISDRSYYCGMYHHVWQALLDGLDNAANMPDFREFKHQDGLVQQLCLTLCHVASQVKLEDLYELEDLLVYHVEGLKEHLLHFQNTAPPERSNGILSAANHIKCLEKSQVQPNQVECLQALKQIFTLNS